MNIAPPQMSSEMCHSDTFHKWQRLVHNTEYTILITEFTDNIHSIFLLSRQYLSAEHDFKTDNFI